MSQDKTRLLALILAGGEGKRLMPLSRDRAKPAVPFGGRYRIIDFVLSNFVNSGFYQIKVLTQYKASSLISHIARGWQLAPILGHYVEPVPAQMRVNRDWFKGSADAVFQNLNLISDTQPEVVAVFGADHIYKMDVNQMVEFHKSKNADLTVAAIPVPIEMGHQFGVIECRDDGEIVGFWEKPDAPPPMPGNPRMCLASMGNYLFQTDVLVNEIVRDANQAESAHDFGQSIVSAMVGNKRTYVYDFATNRHEDQTPKEFGYWRDVGTLDAYWEASMDLVELDPIFNLYNHNWPIRSTYQHLPPAKFIKANQDDGRFGYAVDSLVAPGCVVSGGLVKRSILATSVYVHSWAEVVESVIGEGCQIGRNVKLHRVILDKFVNIEPGIEIGIDHEKDRARGLTVTESGIVAVPKGMHITE